eukprot:2272118-Pyramimonas_sp.AAC.1
MAFPQQLGSGPGQHLGDLNYSFATAPFTKEAQKDLLDPKIELRLRVADDSDRRVHGCRRSARERHTPQ